MLFDEFKPIVELVLNNWTALQLAVEHGMGAPGGKQTAQLMAVYVTRYCVENGAVDRDDLTEVLEDLMDEEFETVCHDNSPREVATLLIQLVTLLREGRRQELTDVLNTLPQCQLWLSQPYIPPSITLHGNPNDLTSSSESEDEGDQEQNTNSLREEASGLRNRAPTAYNTNGHVDEASGLENRPPTEENINGFGDEASGLGNRPPTEDNTNGLGVEVNGLRNRPPTEHNQPEPMDEDSEGSDPGWTVVKGRRKK